SSENFSAHEHARNAAELMKDLESNITQTNPPSSDITQVYDQGQKNSTTLALVVANIVDDILRKYGSAFAVRYDLTNMSNMMNMDMMTMPKMDNSSSHSMDMMATTNVTNGDSILGGHSNTSMIMENDLVNMNDYETAKVLSSNIKDQFSTQLRPRSLVNETTNLDTLENGLERLEEAVDVKALPEAIMDIVHVQFHPMLQRIYDLELQRNVMTESRLSVCLRIYDISAAISRILSYSRAEIN
ncbi:MAG TPA: hypothetical protein VD694_05775, partial [Nitrososphaeraceae archaeon]|nr:hypothetical protein [Nitrososphaeraceae archaeon]